MGYDYVIKVIDIDEFKGMRSFEQYCATYFSAAFHFAKLSKEKTTESLALIKRYNDGRSGRLLKSYKKLKT